MAETLKQWPSDAHRSKLEPYPWDDWLNGRIWKLRRGRDYQTDTTNFQSTVLIEAKRRGLKCKTAKVDEGKALAIQALAAEKP